MSENGNGNSNGSVKLVIGGTALVGLLASAAGWVTTRFDDIQKTFYERNSRISVLEYKIIELEKKQAQDDEMRRRMNALELKR